MEKFIGGEKTTVDYVDIGLSYKIFSVLDMVHLFYISEADCKGPNVEQKPELERPQFNNLVTKRKEILAGIGKILENMPTKVIADPGPQSLSRQKLLRSQNKKFLKIQNQCQK